MNPNNHEVAAGPERPVDCPECSCPLIYHQLDIARPARLVATCPTCGRWYISGLSGGLAPLPFLEPQAGFQIEPVDPSLPHDNHSR